MSEFWRGREWLGAVGTGGVRQGMVGPGRARFGLGLLWRTNVYRMDGLGPPWQGSVWQGHLGRGLVVRGGVGLGLVRFR